MTINCSPVLACVSVGVGKGVGEGFGWRNIDRKIGVGVGSGSLLAIQRGNRMASAPSKAITGASQRHRTWSGSLFLFLADLFPCQPAESG